MTRLYQVRTTRPAAIARIFSPSIFRERFDEIGNSLKGALSLAGDLESIAEALHGAGEQAETLADEYEESATDIEDKVGHSTMISERLQERGDEIREWGDELTQAADEILGLEQCPDSRPEKPVREDYTADYTGTTLLADGKPSGAGDQQDYEDDMRWWRKAVEDWDDEQAPENLLEQAWALADDAQATMPERGFLSR